MKNVFFFVSVCAAAVVGGCSSGSGAPGAGGRGGGGDATQNAPEAPDAPADDGTASAGLPGAGLSALPATTFVFERRIRDTPLAAEVIGFDVATAQRTRITDFDGHGSNPSRIAISPDRKWLAFAALFRPTQADLDTKLGARILYAMSADGSRFHRVTPPIENPWITQCSDDVTCEPLGLTCNKLRSRCEPRNFTLDLHHPAWTADGARLFVDVAQYWSGSTGLQGGQRIAQVPVSGGAPKRGEGIGMRDRERRGRASVWQDPDRGARSLLLRVSRSLRVSGARDRGAAARVPPDRRRHARGSRAVASRRPERRGRAPWRIRNPGRQRAWHGDRRDRRQDGFDDHPRSAAHVGRQRSDRELRDLADGTHIAMCVRHEGGYDIIVRDRAKPGSSGLSQITDDGTSAEFDGHSPRATPPE